MERQSNPHGTASPTRCGPNRPQLITLLETSILQEAAIQDSRSRKILSAGRERGGPMTPFRLFSLQLYAPYHY